MCDANAATHKDGFRLKRLQIRRRASRNRQEGKTGAEREIRGEAGAIDAVRDDEVNFAGVARTAEIDDDALAASMTELDGERTLRAGKTRIADDRRQYIEYQRQPYKADPPRRTFHRWSENLCAQYNKQATRGLRPIAIPRIVKFCLSNFEFMDRCAVKATKKQ